MTGGHIGLHQLAKSFDGVPAVTGIDLDIPAGQFYSLLGASGCGKTTTLRMIAGFEKPDSGRIELDGRDVAGDPPHRRPVNTVFQTYALFPFMSVADNVAFGLKYLKTSKEDAARRVGEALDLVQMGRFAKRRPAQLSGGQQQHPRPQHQGPCCCSTSRSALWMPSCAGSYNSNYAQYSARSASRSSMSPTIKRKRSP